MKPKIGLFDIETAPSLGYYFDLWKEGNIVSNKAKWYMLSWSFKWLNGKTVTKGLIDYSSYSKNKENDLELVKDLWELFNEADILIAHNGNKFDIRKSNARFIEHGLTPPEPYKTIDTLRIAKRYFSFESNKLDALGEYLKVGRKLKHQGFDLWLGCMNGDPKSWAIMKLYNKQDVILLEQVYLKLRPWIQNHPNLSVYQEITGCPNCGSTDLMKQGHRYTQTGKAQQYQCKKCNAWCSGKTEKLTNIK